MHFSLVKPVNKLIAAYLLLGSSIFPHAISAQAPTAPAQTNLKTDAGKAYTLVEQMPQFGSGTQDMLNFISSNIRYPREAITKGVQGTTYVSFVIQPDGTLSQAEAHQKLGHGIEEEALRVVNQMQGQWIPGKQDGKAVPVRFTLPIKFTLINGELIGINQPLTDSLNNIRPLSDPRAKRYLEKQPRFIGGRNELQKFVGENLKYPASAKEGTVIVSFILDEKGNIMHPKVRQSISPEMDAEAIRVVSLMSGKWEPAMNEGKLMKIGYYLPIRIKQTGGKTAPVTPVVPDNTVYLTADQLPAYIAGSEGFYNTISNKLILPADLRQKKLNVRLEVQFVVEKNGSLSDMRITDTRFIKTVSPGSEFDYMDASKLGLVNKTQQAQLVEATLTAIRKTSGQWTPGVRNGQEVRVQVNLPVSFRGNAKAVSDQPEMKTVTILKSAPATKPTAAATKSDQEKKFSHQVVYSDPVDKPRSVHVPPSFNDAPSLSAFTDFLSRNVRYPENTDAQGEAKASFRIEKDGSLSTITVTPGIDPLLEKEIIRVINLMQGSWKPATKDGTPIPSNLNVAFSFVTKDKLTEPKPLYRGVIIVEKLKRP